MGRVVHCKALNKNIEVPEKPATSIRIDLSGPAGNVFALIAQARRCLRDLGMRELRVSEFAFDGKDWKTFPYEEIARRLQEAFGWEYVE